jgi:superfamily II RNA helicase
MQKTYQKKPKRYFKKKPPLPIVKKIKPGSDAKLKKDFAFIGVPEKRPFEPDPFQLEALDAIEQADCLVTVPTGAGKTWIAEKAIARIYEKGGKSWYASPLKALSNSIYTSFQSIFGMQNVGILTGDRKENPEAPIIVGTTEILRNHLYDAMHRGEDLETDFVVLDEAHFLGDEERGVVWEEIMIYLPSRTPLLMLSATVGNGNRIAGWLSSIRSKKCIVVEETKRPVPLSPVFFHPSGTLFPLVSQAGAKGKKRIHKKVVSYINSKNPPLLSHPRSLPPMGDILRVLKKYQLLPAIFFLKSRADCNNAIELCTEEILLTDPERKEKLSRRIEELTTHNPHTSKHRQLWHLENLGVGAHHSGQLPGWKLVIETLLTEGLLDAVFATSTVAAGVNFPSRSVVILNSDRFNGKEFLPLTPSEFHQMTGRAGRRGMDNIGFAVMLPGKFMDISMVSKLIDAPPSEVLSQIRINFSMVLNLLLSHTPDQIDELLKKSFATYLITKRKKKKKPLIFMEDDHKYLWRDFSQHLNFLKENGYVTKNDELTDDGVWASQLRIDQPLMIAEGFRLGIFPESDPALLAAVMASFVNERESEETYDHELMPKELLTLFLNIKKSLKPFAKHMTHRGFEARQLLLAPALTVYAWASGQPWEKVLASSDLAEGDLVRLIMRTADNLNHIKNLKNVFPEVAETSARSIELIMKDPVTD